MKQTDAFPTPPRTKRTTYSLPTETLERIERLAHRLGVSQSAFVAELLSEPIAAMSAIMDALPAVGATPQDVKRAKGRSVYLIRNIVGEAQGLLQSVVHEQPVRKISLTATGPAERRSTLAARGRANPSQASTRSQKGRQGESHRASATAGDSGSGRNATQRPARGGRVSARTALDARSRKTSGAPLKAGRRPKRGSTKR